MPNYLECIICFSTYDDGERRPCIGTCGHSICESCKHQMTSSKCPQCNREEAFAHTTINYQLLEILKKLGKEFDSKDKPEGLELDENRCAECSQKAKKLRICTTCDSKGPNSLLERTPDGDVQLRLLNGDWEATKKAVAKAAICSDCLLDGSHEGHASKVLADLTEEKKQWCGFQKKFKGTSKKPRLVGRIDAQTAAAGKQADRLKIIYENYHGAALGVVNCLDALAEDQDINLHIMNIDSFCDTFDKELSMLNATSSRIEALCQDVQEHTKYVETNKKAKPKEQRVIGPILVADRKQSVKDPLLIGTFDPATNTYASIGRLPNPKSNYAVVAYQTKVYIVGGMYNGTWLNAVEIYDKTKNLRKDAPKLKYARTRTSAAFHAGKLYVCGGYDGNYMTSVEVYDPDRGTWAEGAPLLRARADCAIVTFGRQLYVIGGYNGKEYEDKIERLDPNTGKWELYGDMQGSRAGFAACCFRDRIYIAGGWSNANNTLRTVRSYDPNSNTWREEVSMMRDRKYFTMFATSEYLYAIRGCADSWSHIPEVERFNGEKWEMISHQAASNS